MFGISKQAYYQRIEADKKKQKVQEIILKEVAKIREKKPQTGTRGSRYLLCIGGIPAQSKAQRQAGTHLWHERQRRGSLLLL